MNEQPCPCPPGRFSFGTHKSALLAHTSWLSLSRTSAGTCVCGTHLPPGAPPLKQQLVNVYGGCVGASHDEIVHAPVCAPLNGSVHGAHFSPPGQVDCSSDGCDDTD